jgi:hypothetical protein
MKIKNIRLVVHVHDISPYPIVKTIVDAKYTHAMYESTIPRFYKKKNYLSVLSICKIPYQIQPSTCIIKSNIIILFIKLINTMGI